MRKATAMRVALTVTVTVWLCACGVSQSLAPRVISLQALHGTDLAGVHFDQSASAVSISFDQIPAEGQFVRLTPACSVLNETWTADAGLVHLVIAHEAGVDIGIVPIRGVAGPSANLQLAFSPALNRTVLQAPDGLANAVDDLQVNAEGSSQVRLSWTERNTGDYDFNGEVNIADLTPLGLHFGDAVNGGPAARLTQEYWVDGDHNGEINLSDLTPIGANFLSTVAGYQVYRNGTHVGDAGNEISVSRPTGPFTFSPPVYEFVTSGQPLDEWQVRPVDSEGSEGEPSKLPGQFSLTIASVFQSPPELYELTSLNELSGPSVMRIIWPVDDPYREIMPSNPGLVPPVPLAGGGAGFKGLEPHAGELLYADILFAPQVNLATGSARSGPPFTSPGPLGVPDSYLTLATVPIVLSSGVPASISADVSFTPRLSGGYFVDLASTTSAGGAPVSRTVRLDYPASRVACDTDGDGDFSDEAWLTDTDRDCVSNSRYAQEEYNASHLGVARSNQSFSATVSSFDEQEGLLQLSGGTVVQFSELCGFKSRLVSLAAPDPEDMRPGDLQPGDTVSVQAYTYDTGAASQYWATYIERQEDPGMALSILPQTLADGGSATYLLRYLNHGDLLEAQVLAHEAQDINSIYCALDYDPARFRLVETPIPGALKDLADAQHPFLQCGPASGGKVYSVDSPTPGLHRVQYAASLARPSGPGAPRLGSASKPVDAVLVSLFFYKDQAESAPVLPSVSLDDSSRPVLLLVSNQLSWNFCNPGDYDQNGVVEPADLRLVALHYDQAVMPLPNPDLIAFIDADSSNTIDAGDIGEIYLFRELSVDSFQLFTGPDSGQVDTPLATISLLAAQPPGDPSTLHWFSYLLGGQTGDYYRVVPLFAGQPGVSSAPIQY